MDANSPPPAVHLDVCDVERRARWTACLEEAGFCCQPASAGANALLGVELVVADHLPAEAVGESPADRGTILIGQAAHAVLTGSRERSAAADVCLPADCTDRELVLACRLLAEVVRLRRERRWEKQTRNTLLRLALTDTLTGLGNRRAWHEALDMRWAALRGTRVTLCLAILDLDEFKRLNDDFGHAAGDRALEIAGEVLANEVRRDDFVARLGGDEFGLLLVGVDPEATAAVVERVRSGLSARLSTVWDRPLTVSAGFATTTELQLADSETLFQRADEALRVAKGLGRNRTASSAAMLQAADGHKRDACAAPS